MGLSSAPAYGQVTWDDYATGASTIGLISYGSSLFDGLACNDGHLTLNMISNMSYVKANIPL
jgi:hypothetical protein